MNTMPESLFLTLSERITSSDAASILEGRELQPYDNITTFLEHQALAGLEIKIDGLQVDSDYFLVSVEASFDDFNMSYSSVIHRLEENKAEVVQRYYGSYEGN